MLVLFIAILGHKTVPGTAATFGVIVHSCLQDAVTLMIITITTQVQFYQAKQQSELVLE